MATYKKRLTKNYELRFYAAQIGIIFFIATAIAFLIVAVAVAVAGTIALLCVRQIFVTKVFSGTTVVHILLVFSKIIIERLKCFSVLVGKCVGFIERKRHFMTNIISNEADNIKI